MVKENRMGLARIRSPQQDDIGVLNLTIRTGAATRSEYRRQTDDAGSVSSPVATINVVGPDHRANKLLGNIVQLVGGLGATEHPKGIRAMQLDLFAEALGHAVQRLIPSCRAMRAVLAHQRLSQAVF